MRTRVGYCGGSTKDPTYHNLGDHSETVQIDFDPGLIPYSELLDVFWDEHNPELAPYSRQYMSVIFSHNETQRQAAAASRESQQKSRSSPIRTEIKPYSAFYLAEAYHQKYYLRSEAALMKELRGVYPDDADFINSTAAARVNGYIAGHGTPARLEAELPLLGLSEAGKKLLVEILRRRSRIAV